MLSATQSTGTFNCCSDTNLSSGVGILFALDERHGIGKPKPVGIHHLFSMSHFNVAATSNRI